jgi:pilus assembly protein CpaC
VASADVAEAVVVSPNELLIHGREIGTTSLVIWDAEGGRTLYPVEVTLDAAALETHFRALFPDEQIEVSASGNTYILSGNVTNSTTAERAVEIAEASEAMVVNNMSVPRPHQILLQVRFAEVSRTAMQELSVNFLLLDPNNPRGDDEGLISTGQFNPLSENFVNSRRGPESTFTDQVNLFLFHDDERFSAFIRALQGTGDFKSLAEPNLLALDGTEASFLAGGEFPFPFSTGDGEITLIFKEFGIRLVFTPKVQNSGNIKLKVEPEVSTLDFASGLQAFGFQIPTILSRRAQTEVELKDGQTFAIAGLIDNSIAENLSKVPILGHIPILGKLFQSQDLRQQRSELLVLVTPRLVQPSDEAPPIPTGEPEDWKWKRSLKESVGQTERGEVLEYFDDDEEDGGV